MSLKLAVFNPSNFWRRGHVTVPWASIHQQTGIDPNRLVLRDEAGTPLRYQIDNVDPSDSSHDVLAFTLDRDVPPGPEDYSHPSALVSVEEGSPPIWTLDTAIETIGTRGAKVLNRRLDTWFNLLSGLNNDFQNWFAGSTTTVVLDGKEVLDASPNWMAHDLDKRVMQIDHVHLMSLPWDTMSEQQIPMYNTQYSITSENVGPVRGVIHIMSAPFQYNFTDISTGKDDSLTCKLHREISLYSGADHAMEKVYVEGQATKATSRTPMVRLNFSARYLAHVALGPWNRLYHFAHAPSWLAIGSEFQPYSGYGFATNALTTSITRQGDRHFTWQLSYTKELQCIHVFMRNQRWVDSWTGDYWYRYIYKPLRAAVYCC